MQNSKYCLQVKRGSAKNVWSTVNVKSIFLIVYLGLWFGLSDAGERALPSPTGKFGVSRIAYDWVDLSRAETAINDPSAHRELMVYIWYPTDTGRTGGVRAAYLPGVKEIAKDPNATEAKDFWGDSWPAIASGQVVSETLEDVPIASGIERFPLLVFAPGLGISSTTYTSLIQQLVSHGYVIASIEPTYEVAAVVFSNGRVITERPEATGRGSSPPNESRQQFLKRLHAFDAGHINKWAEDMDFVIRKISTMDSDTGADRAPFAGRIDFSDIGAFGHSFGGRVAARLCQINKRVKACLDADGLGPDGPIFAYEGASLPSQPFMWIDMFHPPPTDAELAPYKMTVAQWEKNHAEQLMTDERELSQYPGNTYHITVNLHGIGHLSFTDQPIIAAKTTQEINDDVETLAVLEDYICDFFSRYLKPSKLRD